MASEGVWCVQHLDGWCATYGNRAVASADTDIKLMCRRWLRRNLGVAKREPTCVSCLAALNDTNITSPTHEG